MTNTTNNPWEQLFRQMGAEFARQAKEAFIGTVSSVSSSGIGLTIDGDNTGTKKYTCARSERFASGDRVLVVRVSGTYVAVCKIGSPGGPTAATLSMTQPVGADSSGKLWTEPLAVATASKLGGVKPVAKTNAMTQDVGVDEDGRLYTLPATSYELPTASTSQLGGVKTSEAYSSTKHTVKVAANSTGVLYAEAYSLPTASTTALGGIKTSEAYSSTKHTVKVAVNSSGVLYAASGESYELPTASTSQLGGIKTSEAYSSTKHTVKVAVNSSGVLYAEQQSAGNVSRIYAGTSTTSYLEMDSQKVLKPSGTGFNLGNSTYPFADVYMGKTGSNSYYLKVSDASIIPNSTTALTSYYNLGSSIYPFNRLYVKELYINGTKFTPS